MRRSSVLASIAALGLFLAACGEETTDPVAGADEDGTEAPADPDLAVAASDLGEILVDGDEMTLYLFTEDPPGESVCFDDCLTAWPPLLVDGEPSVGEGVDEALVGTLERDDGSTQVTYDDAPLYLWASDEQPGDVTGQDVQGVWFVVSPDGRAITEGADTDAETDDDEADTDAETEDDDTEDDDTESGPSY